MADELLQVLDINSVRRIDLREFLHKENISWIDAFYTTVHHWKPATGLWAAGKIADQIDVLEGTKAEEYIFDIANYDVSVTEKVYMGGFVISVTSVYTDKDNMEIWNPNFHIDFVKTVPAKGLESAGNFNEVMYDVTIWPSYGM